DRDDERAGLRLASVLQYHRERLVRGCGVRIPLGNELQRQPQRVVFRVGLWTAAEDQRFGTSREELAGARTGLLHRADRVEALFAEVRIELLRRQLDRARHAVVSDNQEAR